MNLQTLMLRELAYRKGATAASVLVIALGVAGIILTVLALHAFDRDTAITLARLSTESRAAWTRYKDDVRKDMLTMGFNLMILHKDQHLSTPDDQAHVLPETYAARLARERPRMINHLLPFLQQKVWWPERRRWITLVGTGGEIHILNPSFQTPLLPTVNDGHAILGYAIHQSLDLETGAELRLMGHTFTVQECLPAKSFQEDEQVWLPLRTAQQLLDKPGSITGMLAVDCNCSPTDLLALREQITDLLPDTRVIEYNTRLLTRATVRARAARQADAALERERTARDLIKARHVRFASRLVPGAALLSMAWLAFVSWLNVRSRRAEIGVLSAMGVSRGRILTLFLGKAALTGFLAGTAGVFLGMAAAAARLGPEALAPLAADARLPAGCILGSVLLAVAASWLPALAAATVDPARVLNET
jgi:hypothetical protein